MKNNINGIFYGRQTPNDYEIGKMVTQEKAIDYQLLVSKSNLSYSEINYLANYFTKLGKRYGLLKEFRENGII